MALQISNANGFIFTVEDLQDPLGKNNLTAFAASFQRTLYKDEVYPQPSSGVPSGLDTWYNRAFYGRIDRDKNSLILKTSFLKQIAGSTKPLFVFDFVADGFKRFGTHMANAYMAGAVSKTGNAVLLAPTAMRGYEDPTRAYRTFHQNLAQSFLLSFLPPAERPIDGFETFVSYYGPFLKGLSHFMPITKSTYMLSYRLDPMSTGLSVAISNHDAADDAVKYNEFISDANYRYYVNAAKRFGFLVDENKPWVLTADLFTKALAKFLYTYLNPLTYEPITQHNFFPTYYTPTYMTDLEDLQETLLSAYRYAVLGSPLYRRRTQRPDGTFEHSSHPREPYNAEQLRSQLSPQFLIDLYLDIRQAESDAPYEDHEVERLRRAAYQAYWTPTPLPISAYQRAAGVINNHYRRYSYPVTLTQLTGRSLGDIRKNGLVPPKK